MYAQTFKTASKRDESMKTLHRLNKNFSLILEMSMLIGIYFPYKTSSRINEISTKIIRIALNLFSMYYFILLSFHSCKSNFDFQFITTALQFILATFIRLYLSLNAKRIVENSNILLNKMSGLSRRYEKTCRNLIITALTITFSTFPLMELLLHLEENLVQVNIKYMLFDYTASQISLIVFVELLIALRNWIIFVVPYMAIILLSFIYYELGNVVYGLKTKILDTMNAQFSDDLLQMNRCCYFLSKTMQTVRRIDGVLTTPMFYVLSFLLIQIMALISIVTKDDKNTPLIVVSLFLAWGVFISLIFIVGLASRIPDNFSGLKNTILTSSIVRQKIMSGKTESISYIGFVQALDNHTENFYVTAMGCIKIEKTVILTMLCAFVSYGVMLNQMISNNLKLSNGSL